MGKKVTRTRGWWTPDDEGEAQQVTILERGRRKSRIRTMHGFVHDDIPNAQLDKIEENEADDEPSEGSFTFEVPSAH